MTKPAASALLLAACLAGSPAWAQLAPVAPPAPVAPGPVLSDSERGVLDARGASGTRQELWMLLRQYPPALGEVLQRDPSLLDRPDYLTPYPRLSAFLERHPEVRRSPGFYFGDFAFRESSPQQRAINFFETMVTAAAILVGFCAFLGAVVWTIRTVVDQRRWLRQSRVQVEVHGRILDRLTSNEDLLAYAQTPAGSRFLESAPIELAGETRSTPVWRILWSLQAGVVLVALGLGLFLAQGTLMEELRQGFRLLATVALSLGLGFAASAGLAYLVSTRMGLLPGRQA
jgi:hypothetical protein